MSINESERYRRSTPGPQKLLPKDQKLAAYPGLIISTHVPNVEVEPFFSLDNRVFGRREPVDYVSGQVGSAEINLILEYWDIDQIDGRVILCPAKDRDFDLLRKLIGYAYVIEETIEKGRDQLSFLKTVWKRWIR